MAKVRKPRSFGEDRILALLTAAFSAPVNAPCSSNYGCIGALGARGQKLAQNPFEHYACKLENGEQAFRLFLAISDRVGPLSTRSLQVLGFDLPKGLRKFDSESAARRSWPLDSGGGGGDAGSAEARPLAFIAV